jgi:steroid delta-isomerase-like uncharacterized protein
MPTRRKVTLRAVHAAALLSPGLALAGGLAGRASAQEAASTVPPRAVAERFAQTLSAHDIDGFAALFAEDYVNHQLSAAAPPPPGVPDKQASVAFFRARLAGMPDLRVAIEALVAEGDRVAASFVYTGTHGGTWFGVAPTGRALRFSSCDIFRVAGGRIAEHWGMGDIAGVMAQLRG